MTDAEGNDYAWTKQATRLRILARDPAVRAYLLGRFLEGCTPTELQDLVEACLVYLERFGASGNRRRALVDPPELTESYRWVSTDTPERGGRKP